MKDLEDRSYWNLLYGIRLDYFDKDFPLPFIYTDKQWTTSAKDTSYFYGYVYARIGDFLLSQPCISGENSVFQLCRKQPVPRIINPLLQGIKLEHMALLRNVCHTEHFLAHIFCGYEVMDLDLDFDEHDCNEINTYKIPNTNVYVFHQYHTIKPQAQVYVGLKVDTLCGNDTEQNIIENAELITKKYKWNDYIETDRNTEIIQEIIKMKLSSIEGTVFYDLIRSFLFLPSTSQCTDMLRKHYFKKEIELSRAPILGLVNTYCHCCY